MKWSENRIQNILDEWRTLGSLVIDFIDIKTNLENKEEFVLNDFWFDDNIFNVYCENNRHNSDFNWCFNEKEFEELMKFMNEPELFRKAHKYNL